MPDGLVTPQVPATQVVFGTLQLGQAVEPLPAVQLAVALLLDEDTLLEDAVLPATELLADEALLELDAAALDTAALDADEARLLLEAAELDAEEDTEAALEAEDDLLELALETAVDEALLLDPAPVVGIEHSFTPPVMRPPKVALLQAKLPDSVR